MRAVQRVIVGTGLALAVTTTAMLLISEPNAESDRAGQSTQSGASRFSFADLHDGPDPVTAAEDPSVGTLPPPAGAGASTQFVSRDLVTPAPRTPSDSKQTEAPEVHVAKPRAKAVEPTPDEADLRTAREGWDVGWDLAGLAAKLAEAERGTRGADDFGGGEWGR